MTSTFHIIYKNGAEDIITCEYESGGGYTETARSIKFVNRFNFHYTISKSIIAKVYRITKRKKEEIKL